MQSKFHMIFVYFRLLGIVFGHRRQGTTIFPVYAFAALLPCDPPYVFCKAARARSRVRSAGRGISTCSTSSHCFGDSHLDMEYPQLAKKLAESENIFIFYEKKIKLRVFKFQRSQEVAQVEDSACQLPQILSLLKQPSRKICTYNRKLRICSVLKWEMNFCWHDSPERM